MIDISSTHDMQEYLALLTTSSTIYIDSARLDSVIKQASYTAEDYRTLTSMWMQIESNGSIYSAGKEGLLDILELLGVDIDKCCRVRNSDNYSVDIKRVLQPLYDRGIATDILGNYIKYSSYRSYSNNLRSMQLQRKFHTQTSDGSTIVKFDTHVKEKENLRTYYSDIAVVSIPRVYSNIITTKGDDYYIAWCDYPQADWRLAYNLFIRNDTNVATMRETDDAYKGLAKIIRGDNYDEAEFLAQRKEYKVHTLKVFYNSKDSSPAPTAIRNYFMSCPAYAKYYYDLSLLYQFKLPIPCKSYFGFEQMLPEQRRTDDFIAKGMNTPVQTFTSHLVNETVFSVLNQFYALGYTQDDINVYYVRHDEPLFMFKKTVLKDAWIFKNCSQIHISGFTPISLEFHYGKYYKEDDQSLTNEINEASNAHPELIETYEEGLPRTYSPTPKVESVYVQFFSNPQGGATLKFFNYRTNEIRIINVSTADTDEALHAAIEENILAWLGTPEYLLVKNNSLELIDRVGEATLMKVVGKVDPPEQLRT